MFPELAGDGDGVGHGGRLGLGGIGREVLCRRVYGRVYASRVIYCSSVASIPLQRIGGGRGEAG